MTSAMPTGWIPLCALFQRNNFLLDPFPNFMTWVERWEQRKSYQDAIVECKPSAT